MIYEIKYALSPDFLVVEPFKNIQEQNALAPNPHGIAELLLSVRYCDIDPIYEAAAETLGLPPGVLTTAIIDAAWEINNA